MTGKLSPFFAVAGGSLTAVGASFACGFAAAGAADTPMATIATNATRTKRFT